MDVRIFTGHRTQHVQDNVSNWLSCNRKNIIVNFVTQSETSDPSESPDSEGFYNITISIFYTLKDE